MNTLINWLKSFKLSEIILEQVLFLISLNSTNFVKNMSKLIFKENLIQKLIELLE
jgi:hypothetical protein